MLAHDAADGLTEEERAALLHEAFLEQEMTVAPRHLSEHLFHYTNAESAIFGILAGGTLRLSPFESTNDLWESRPLHPTLSAHYEDEGPGDSAFDLWHDVDRNIRLRTKVACLTQDWSLPDEVLNPNALRGWAHLSLWAHYGAGHSGICLRFDRTKLIRSFLNQSTPETLRFHGPVRYLSATAGPGTRGIDWGQVKEFGSDAVAMAYAAKNKDLLFFRKHSDWANESEYRLILLNQSILPSHVDIRGALTGVFLGDAFPQQRLQALLETLQPYPDVEIHQLRFHNRLLQCFPFDGAAQRAVADPGPWGPLRREGSLQERFSALLAAEEEAHSLRQRAQTACSAPLSLVERGISSIASEVGSWADASAAVHERVHAVPPPLRARRPGVTGERVHFERGFICVINVPDQSLTASAAVQALDDGQLRVHVVLSAEPQGAPAHELWRDDITVPITDAGAAVTTILGSLVEAVREVRPTSDQPYGPT